MLQGTAGFLSAPCLKISHNLQCFASPSPCSLYVQTENASAAICSIASHYAIVTIHENSVSSIHWRVQNSKTFSLQLSPLQAEWSQSPKLFLTHPICPSYFSGLLLGSCQFASIFLIELHLFCLSKAKVREDLKMRGLCKPSGKEDQGTESWSQINWITTWVLSY